MRRSGNGLFDFTRRCPGVDNESFHAVHEAYSMNGGEMALL